MYAVFDVPEFRSALAYPWTSPAVVTIATTAGGRHMDKVDEETADVRGMTTDVVWRSIIIVSTIAIIHIASSFWAPTRKKAKRPMKEVRSARDPEYKTLELDISEWESVKIMKRSEINPDDIVKKEFKDVAAAEVKGKFCVFFSSSHSRQPEKIRKLF
ncbi:hypothetical protein Y032_0027g1611 [Ancylostoma ceylanicum]|uniref:Uncharacterized protein n=1 Tax=Ancylostoma ceylanicum TaxID=53326 RepID=A0A016UUH6_9BILA|nr:hypothetical protein Y032_0027g1611 [Ancylostoma ceylanicum]